MMKAVELQNYFLAFFLGLSMALSASEKTGIITEDGNAGSFDAGYFGVWQDRLNNVPIVYLSSTTTNNLTANIEETAQNITPRYATGTRIQGELNPNPLETAQFVFIGFINWQQNGLFIAPEKNIYIPIEGIEGLDNWQNIANLYYSYHDQIFSFELSYWRHLTPRFSDYFSFSILGGLRYIGLKDRLEYLASQASEAQNTLRVQQNNRIIGVQTGLDINYRVTERFFWVNEFKFTLAPNFIEQQIFLTDDSPEAVVNDSEHYHLTATYGFDLVSTFSFHLGFLCFKAGVQWLSLFNIALSPYQVVAGRDIDNINWNEIYTIKGVHVDAGFNF